MQRFEQYKDAFGHVLPLQAVSDHVDHAAAVATVVDAPSDWRRHRGWRAWTGTGRQGNACGDWEVLQRERGDDREAHIMGIYYV